jgi:MYXO-CTERM domain-containing protein
MRTRRRLGGFGWASASLIASAFVLAPRAARAEQFVLFDATFPYTWDNAINSTPSKSHYYVNEGNWLNKARPVNWTSPVNYRDGTVHIHVEVLEKPAGGQMVGWALCIVGNSGSYGCPYTPYYTQLGVYERDVGMHNFFNSETINWAQGVKQVDLVYTVNDSGSGHISNFPELKDLTTPTKVRIAMIVVSQGAKYDPAGLPGADGGAPEGGSTRDGGSSSEAGAPDARADVGSAGAAGTGGAGGSGSGGAGGQGTGASGAATGGSAGVATSGAGGQGQGGSPTGTAGSGAAGASAGTGGSRGGGGVDGGCNCSTGSSGRGSLGYAWLALLAFAWSRRRRR